MCHVCTRARDDLKTPPPPSRSRSARWFRVPRGAKPSAAAAPPAAVSPEAQQLAAVLLQPEHSEVLLAALQRAAARAPPPTVAATPAAPPTGDLRAMQAQKQMQRLAERTVLAPLCLFAR